MQVPQFIIQVIYNGVAITADIAKAITHFRYKDNVDHKLDEIELTLADPQLKWSNKWYPKKSDTMQVSIGDVNDILNCGTFKIDEVETEGPPNTVVIKGISLNITKSMRSKKSFAHENKTLAEIANTIASANGLTLQGNVPAITIIRATQNNETDLKFLNRISSEYGIMFNVRDKLLIFTSVFEIEATKSVTSLDVTDATHYKIKDKSFSTFKSATVNYHNPRTSKLVNYKIQTVTNADNISFNKIESDNNGLNITTPVSMSEGNPIETGIPSETGDDLLITKKTENSQQAKLKALAAIHLHNSKQKEGDASFPGNTKLIAGNNFDFTGIGANSGKYHIMSSEHNADKSGGWTVDIDFKMVGFLEKVKNVPKNKKPKKPATYKVIK